MKQLLLSIVVLTLGLIQSAHAFNACETWVGSPSANALASKDFSLRVWDHPAKPEIKKDLSIVCSLVLPSSSEHTLSRICIDGKVSTALPYLSELAKKDLGFLGDLRITKFETKSASSKRGAIFTLTTQKRTGYVTPTVNCEGCSAEPATPSEAPGTSEYGTGPGPSEWTTPLTREILIPTCATAKAPIFN